MENKIILVVLLFFVVSCTRPPAGTVYAKDYVLNNGTWRPTGTWHEWHGDTMHRIEYNWRDFRGKDTLRKFKVYER